jgi:hypothetical protein
MNNFIKLVHPKNKINLFLGKMDDDGFNINLDENLQEKIVNFFKPSCNNVVHQQCKYYYYNDMKYIIMQNGIHKCIKNKIHKYSTTNNVMICSVQEIIVPIEQFPPISTYHDTRIIERSLFNFINFSLDVMNVVYNSGYISHECIITVNNNNTLMDPLLQEFIQEFGYNLDFTNETIINHGNNNILSIV